MAAPSSPLERCVRAALIEIEVRTKEVFEHPPVDPDHLDHLHDHLCYMIEKARLPISPGTGHLLQLAADILEYPHEKLQWLWNKSDGHGIASRYGRDQLTKDN